MNDQDKTYLALGAAATAYAAGLNTKTGKQFADAYTWMSVVVGTSLVLFFLRRLLPEENWRQVATAFTVAGTPMIARSLINKFAASND